MRLVERVVDVQHYLHEHADDGVLGPLVLSPAGVARCEFCVWRTQAQSGKECNSLEVANRSIRLCRDPPDLFHQRLCLSRMQGKESKFYT